MNKDFNKKKLLSFDQYKQIKILYDLAIYIEKNKESIHSSHFEKLKKYHSFLEESEFEKIQKINKEFLKIKRLDYQFQIYLMNLERLLGQSKKEYDFLVSTKDCDNTRSRIFPIICLLDSVRSAHNIGAIFRNAECFGVEKIILCGLSPTPENIQVQKTAMGCEKKVEWEQTESATQMVSHLKKEGYDIWAIETSHLSINLNDIKKLPKKLVVIFGHEQFGISHELIKLSDEIVSIPTYGTKNSLNVSCGQAVTLNHLAHLANLDQKEN